MSFFDFWRSTKERRALLRRANQLRLNPSQLTLLLGDNEVRAALQDERMVSLLPPVGMEVFRRFTVASLEEIQQQHEAEAMERKKRKHKKATEKNLLKAAAHLETGKPLPFIYGDPPPQFLNTPLEDLDPFYQSKKAFMVLSNGNIINRFSADSSCYLLSPFNPLRTVAIKILLQPFFSLFILLTILINCMLPSWFPVVTYVCTAIYMFEALVKVVARGFCVGHFTFLRDPWNWLDIVIISTLLVSEFVSLGKLVVLIKFSLLLKIFTCNQGLKKTVEALVQSVKMLADVIILTGFCLSIFAMIGLQFFMGSLKHKCVIWPMNMNMTVFHYDDYITSPGNYYYIPGHRNPLVCGNQSDTGLCPEGFICMRAGHNPNYGYTSYDSFFWSLLSLFRLMMQDNWECLMQLTLRAAGKFNLSIFVLVFFPGCFFLLSLILAVVAMTRVEQEEAQCADAKQREETFRRIVEVLKRREEEEQQASSRTEILEEQDSLQKKKSVTSIQANKQEHNEETEEHHRPLCCTCIDPFLKGDCCGCWRWLKQQFHTFIMNPFFDLVIIICIIVSTIFTAMEHYPMTDEFMKQLAIAELVFTGIFIAEMIIKLVALGLYGYFQVRWHIFDFILVIVSLVELVLTNVEGLSVLSLSFQLRVFRLARWWPMLHMFLKIVWASVGNLTLVLFITVFMFSVAGMQLFHTDYKNNICHIAVDCQLPRWHMHDFFHTFILVFTLLCGQWIENMWDCMEVSNDGVCVVFFMIVLIIGNLLILHLFLSSLFTNDQLVDPEEKGSNNLQRTVKQTRTWILEIIWTLQGKKKHTDLDHKAGDTKRDNKKEYLALSSVSSDQVILDDNHTNMAVHEAPVAVAEVEFRTHENEQEMKKQDCDMQKRKDETHTGNIPEDCCCNSCYLCCPFLEIDTSQGTRRFLSNFRRASLCIVQHKFFEGFIVFIILLSCAALVFEDIYLEHRPILQRVLNMADLVFTFVFVVEMLLKWIAFGFKKYFTSFWCWLDFLILDVSLFSLMVDMVGYPSRPLRALRTLRVPSRFKGMRVVLKALTVMLPSMFSVLLVTLVIWLVFSVMGVKMFAGRFSYCYNKTSEEFFTTEQVNNKTECISLLEHNFSEVQWKNKKFNFDNVGMGFLSLLIMGSSSGWLDIMYAAVDTRQVEAQPHYESNLYMYMYFICFIIIGCFFTLNIFIRVFIDTIHQHRHKFGGKHVFMTEEQQKYLRTMKKRFSEKRNTVPRPENWCLARLFDLVTTLSFEIFMVVVICLNMVALMVETDDQSLEKESVMFWIHFIFMVIFLVEFILKIMALRKHYFRNGLNIVDFVVLIVSIAGTIIADILSKYLFSPSIFPVFRLGRLFAVCGTLHHISYARKVWMLIMGFVMSLPALLNIGLLLFLIVYTFSIIGMFNFAYLKNEMMIDDMFNFKTFGNSIISVIMITTSSGWDGLLSPIMNQPPDCDPGLPYPGNCANPAVGIVFFTSYILLFRLLVIHLFITVILEIFNTASSEEAEDPEMLNDDHFQMFYKTWRKFDLNGSQVIQYSELADFCDALQDPLRIPKPNAIKLTHLNLPLFPGDQISCLDVLREITTQVFGKSGEVDVLKAKLDDIFRINSQVSCEPVIGTLPPQQTADVIGKHVEDEGGEGTSAQAVGGASQ